MTDVNEIVAVAFDENSDYGPLIMCVEDHMRPPTQGVMLSQLVRGKHKYAYEVLGVSGRRLFPFFDWETYRDSPEALARDKWAEWEICIQKLKAQFGENVKIVGLDACGKKGDRYIISFHAFVHGVGAYRCGKDMLRAGIVPQGFDTSVYKEEDSRQLFRMAGMSKAGEDRPFRYITKHEGEWKSADIWKMDEQARRLVMLSTLAQCSMSEHHVDVEQKEVPVAELKQTESGKIIALGVNGKPLGEDVKLNAGDIRALCVMAGWFQEVDRDYVRWRDEMWLLQNTADDTRLDLDELMLEVSRVCMLKHTDQSTVGIRAVTANRPTNMERKNLGQLRTDAEIKDPIAYGQWYERVKKEKQLENAGGDKQKASVARLADTELNDADVAEALIEGGWLDDYIWDYATGVMYVWNGVHWKPSTKDILTTLIQVELYGALEAYARSKWTAENTNPLKCIGAIKRLRNSRSTDGIVKSTCGLLMRKRPTDGIEWNNVPFKLAFDNGVLNLTSGVFEQGNKEDHLTMTTGWSLPLEVNSCVDVLRAAEAKRIAKMSTLYEKIQPNADIRAILWQIMGSCLVGQILENVFILTGEGRNGKSVSTDLLKSVLGPFSYRGDDATIQRDTGSGTNQAVVNMKHKRLTLFAEPYEGCKLRTSILKDLTGSSETHARGLYSTSTTIKLAHTLVIECNGGVNYDKVDQAIEKRTVIVPFPSLFTTQQEIDALPPGTENIYLVNPKYKTLEWQKKHRVATLLKMFDGLREMMAVSNGQFILSKIPEVMRAVKHEFLENSDEIGSWFFEEFEKSEEKDAFLKMTDVHNSFLGSRTYSNFSKQERRNKGKKNFLTDKLSSNPRIKPFYRDRYQPRVDGVQKNFGQCILGFSRVPPNLGYG